jgi:hypothetical protein
MCKRNAPRKVLKIWLEDETRDEFLQAVEWIWVGNQPVGGGRNIHADQASAEHTTKSVLKDGRCNSRNRVSGLCYIDGFSLECHPEGSFYSLPNDTNARF